MIRFDHIAIGAFALGQGADYVAAHTGLTIPLGGAHPLMGTHNCLMATGLDTFLEVISVDPAASAPSHPRWFGLDDPVVKARLEATAQPHAWILRSDDLGRDLAVAKEHGVDIGTPLTLTRGALNWQFAVRSDGAIPLEGAAPMMMQWPEAPIHPAAQMPNLGVKIAHVLIQSPHAKKLAKMVKAIGGDIAPVEIRQAPSLSISVDLTLKSGQKVLLS